MKKIISIITLLNLLIIVNAQLVVPVKQYHLDWDNDVMMTTDHYYSQGIGFAMYSPAFERNPANLILLKPKNYDRIIYGLSVFQKTYTPKDIRSDEVQYNDRPYAGVLTINSQLSASDLSRGLLFNSQLELGVMGPASGAGKVQYVYHDITNNPLPNGWGYQHYNWPVVNYNFIAFKSIYASQVFDFLVKGKVRIGTLHDDISTGFLLRLGKSDGYIKSLGMNIPLEFKSNWQYYLEVEPTIRAIAYDGTMMGGWYRNKNIYYIPFSELTYIVPGFRSGLALMYKVFGLRFNVIYTGKEFNEGSHHWYHNTTLFLSF